MYIYLFLILLLYLYYIIIILTAQSDKIQIVSVDSSVSNSVIDSPIGTTHFFDSICNSGIIFHNIISSFKFPIYPSLIIQHSHFKIYVLSALF